MKRLRWLVVSLACFLIGIITLLNGWNGTANATAGWPIAATAVTFCGSAHGWAAAVGLAGLLLGMSSWWWASSVPPRYPLEAEEPIPILKSRAAVQVHRAQVQR